MKRLFLAIVIFYSFDAFADWVQISASDNGKIFADQKTIRRSGNTVKLWFLANLEKPEEIYGKSYYSSRSQISFNCKDENFVYLYISYYQYTEGNGENVYTIQTPPNVLPTPVAPGTVGEGMYEYACVYSVYSKNKKTKK